MILHDSQDNNAMNKLTIFLLAVGLLVLLPKTFVLSQQHSLGRFAGRTDVGSPVRTSRATYDADKQEYTIAGAGTNIWANHDEFQFVWQRLNGNFILTATAAFIGKGVEPHRKIGWMIRSSLADDSPHAFAACGPAALTFKSIRENGRRSRD